VRNLWLRDDDGHLVAAWSEEDVLSIASKCYNVDLEDWLEEGEDA